MSESLWTLAIGWAAGPTSIATRAVCYCCTQSIIIFCNSSAAGVTLKTRKLPTKSMDKTWMPPDWEFGFQECALVDCGKAFSKSKMAVGADCEQFLIIFFWVTVYHEHAKEASSESLSNKKIRVVVCPISAFSSLLVFTVICIILPFWMPRVAVGKEGRPLTV